MSGQSWHTLFLSLLYNMKKLFSFLLLGLLTLLANAQTDIIPSSNTETFRKGFLATKDLDKVVKFKQDTAIEKEAFHITVSRRRIYIEYADEGGKLYALQTLHKLAKVDGRGRFSIPCCDIYEKPRSAWRGLLLDSGRQYQSIATIKKQLDLLCSLRMNVFHWHLTEGLGWRLEIKKYPRLAQEGSRVGKKEEQQGFYTQEQVKDIIRYAAERNITVVPEIDMPGHAEAALYCYPEMGCFGVPAEIPETGFTDVIFCAGKDRTLRFLEDILDEVCELFPSEYIHLGGDEAPKGNWDKCPDCANRMKVEGLTDTHQLQLWFSAKMAEYLKNKGRKVIFYEDVLSNASYPLPDNVTIQWWNYRGHKDTNMHKALAAGIPVICSPNYYTYLNFPLSPWKGYENNRTFNMEDAYTRNPMDMALTENSPLIIGAECALWTDYELTEKMLDERLFPRIYALAQLMWAGKTLDFQELLRRVGKQ